MSFIRVEQSQGLLESLSIGRGEVLADMTVEELFGELQSSVGRRQTLSGRQAVEIGFGELVHSAGLGIL